ncbi:MAG: sensor histidine kinase [Ruminiclostridium sp.]|nr:sensor histidine kinase [Ruminiclostridium sp.]
MIKTRFNGIKKLGIKKLIEEKFTSRLSIQLILSFLVMFMIVVAVSFVFLYSGIVSILSRNSESNIIQRFEQSDFNISRFSDNIDLISRQLVIDGDLQGLTRYGTMPESDQVSFASSVLRKFSNIVINFKYIDSVIYYGADGLIIKSSVYGNYIVFDEASKDNWFYKSKQYNDSKTSKQKLIWFGGYTDRDFGLANSDQKGDTRVYHVSAARNILAGSNSGALVINITEDYFTSLYNNSRDTGTGSMYIINNEGKVISSRDYSKLAKKSELYRKVDPNSSQGTFTVENPDNKVQVVYYKLNNSIGILVSEMPMSEILKDIVYMRKTLAIIFFLSLAVVFVLSRFWILKLMKPLKKLTDIIKKIRHGDLGLTLEQTPKNELGVLVSQFNKMSTSIKELFHKNELIQTEKRNMEMEALRAQINPHFIYNTLNTIKWMAVINKSDNIVDSVTTLSDFLGPIFKKHDIMCMMEEEISYIENYVKIMNYRFAGKFKLNIAVPDELMTCEIIRFILQPVVENALIHGLMNKVSGEISITASAQARDLLIKIIDDGDGISESRLNEIRENIEEASQNDDSSIGLSNVNRRIKLHCGEQYGLSICSRVGEGTEVRFMMPLVRF